MKSVGLVAVLALAACGGDRAERERENEFQEKKKENKVEVSTTMPSGERWAWLFLPGESEVVSHDRKATLARTTPMVFVVYGEKGPMTYTCADRATESHNDHTVYVSNETSNIKFTVWN
jgi:hypothetical protein